MGFIRTALKGAVAGKAIQMARKPENQQKAKSMFSRLTGKGGSAKQTPAKGGRKATTTRTRKAGKPTTPSR